MSIIDNIINSHLGEKVDSFKLYIPAPSKYNFPLKKWIQIVASKGLEELELQVATSINRTTYNMESNSIDIDTLYVLKLTGCGLSLSPNSKSLRLLKSLSLTRVQVVPLFIKKLFIHCVVLESLALDDCSSTGDLTIKGSNKFRTLLIRNCGDITLITVDNQNINTFHYDGQINKIKFVDPIISKDVILNLGIATWLQHISERHDLIEVLRNVQILSINNIVLEGLSPKYVDFEHIDMELYLPNLKELQIVIYGLSFVNPCDIILFVKNCPQIERLFLDLGNYAMEAGSYWNSIAKEKLENCKIEFPQLKLLKVKGFKRLELEKKLVNFFSSRAKWLESLIIVSKENCLEIELSDVITVSNTTMLSTYRQYEDKSCVFPKHGDL
ncbi:FBD-associated F-box protein At1g61320-like [Solanum verrucosum]|uniref:FBD-associated F-box protein At1g61320-like n=1 Tax=Solanum verrucosum TaxID=315347 RepID=UPI0020D10FC1|nr:FBD-associated F-box protein At1g61320-like [Solanum verrucosum]